MWMPHVETKRNVSKRLKVSVGDSALRSPNRHLRLKLRGILALGRSISARPEVHQHSPEPTIRSSTSRNSQSSVISLANRRS